MKKLILISILLFTQFPLASPNEIDINEFQSLEEMVDTFKKDYQWLFEELIPEKYRDEKSMSEAERSFYPHMADTYRIYPHPNDIEAKNLKIKDEDLIIGSIKYVGFWPKKYRYNLYLENGAWVIEVRVHFKNTKQFPTHNMQARFIKAQRIWNDGRVIVDFPYEFRFLVVDNKEDAHFSVKFKKGTRGPYDSKWDPQWPSSVVAHELGHMLGLGDEYRTLSGKVDCLRVSLMCTSWGVSKPMAHHYYFILRRLVDLPKQ